MSNENHDDRGRFASGEGGGSTGQTARAAAGKAAREGKLTRGLPKGALSDMKTSVEAHRGPALAKIFDHSAKVGKDLSKYRK